MEPSTRGRDCSGKWWERLEVLFEAASALPKARRGTFLQRACPHDSELRAELISLLRYVGPAPESSSLLSGAQSQPTPASPAGDPLAGRTLRNYKIDDRLGEGGMGVVYHAHDVLLGRPVALKFLSPALSKIPSAKKRFLVEARAAAAIDHPNICTVYDVGEADDGAPFIAMAYYQGETLKQKLSRGRLSIADAILYLSQTAEGVRAAHARGVLHRDVKPGNIFITHEGVAKLLDFGVAKMANLVLTKAGVALGTVGYMSPEQLRGAPVDARTDIWSLGVVLFEVIASQPPFRGERAGQIVRAALFDEPPSLVTLRPDAPLPLNALIRRALAKDPSDRQPTVACFLAELRAAVSEQANVS